MINLDIFERIPEDECWREYGWGSESKKGTEVLHLTSSGFEIFCNEMVESYGNSIEDVFGCEIYDDIDMLGQWFDSSHERAIAGATVESVGFDVIENYNNSDELVDEIVDAAFAWLCDIIGENNLDSDIKEELAGFAEGFINANSRWVRN